MKIIIFFLVLINIVFTLFSFLVPLLTALIPGALTTETDITSTTDVELQHVTTNATASSTDVEQNTEKQVCQHLILKRRCYKL